MRTLPIITAVFFAALCGNAIGEPLPTPVEVKFPNEVKAGKNISGIAKVHGFLVIGADEAVGQKNNNLIQLMKQVGDNDYQFHEDIELFEGDDENGKEMDIEGIAVEGDIVYVIGSHSTKRKCTETSKKYGTNRKTFRYSKIVPEKNRGRLYRLKIEEDGKVKDKEWINLRKIIHGDEALRTFSGIPGKENGVDIEGVAVKGDMLYLGFRGPVFRGNWVPVMKLEFEDPEEYELDYVNLGGRGIRDITRVSNGFLLIAGPAGDSPASYQLYHWNGKDMIPGKNRDANDKGKVALLGEINPPPSAQKSKENVKCGIEPDVEAADNAEASDKAKAEGIVVLSEEGTSYDLILVYDGAARGSPQRFRFEKK